MAKACQKRGCGRRLRQRLFDAGKIRCPICLSNLDKSDVLAGTNVTLEYAPPKALGGSAVCLTCQSCNNMAGLVDQHASASAKARTEWTEGKGSHRLGLVWPQETAPVHRPISKCPFPARKHLLWRRTIELDPLPPKHLLNADKGISFRILQRDDYEFVGMIKSAYLQDVTEEAWTPQSVSCLYAENTKP